MTSDYLNALVFKHMVELKSTDCVFCSTEQKQTGKRELFLVFNQHGKVYSRNGLKGTWEEVKDDVACESIHKNCEHVRRTRDIPWYTA